MSYELGGVQVNKPDITVARLAMLLWGDAGCGKTTLACTAPGVKLLIQFDPDGALSVANRNDVEVLDLSKLRFSQIIPKFKTEDPFGLDKFFTNHEEVETVVVDSMTAYAYIALQDATYNSKSSTMEQPGMHGYAWRNTTVLRMATALMQLTSKHNRNIIFTTHEGTPKHREDGSVSSITTALSEGTEAQLGLRLNEVWLMKDTGKARNIHVRPFQLYKPMKTRMFDASARASFAWKYDAATMQGEGINDWLVKWRANAGAKIALPA